jgi:inhibitor of KinA
MPSNPRILLCGDTAISVEFGDAIDPGINARVRRLFRKIGAARPPGILDLNPTYRSLFIQYDPWECSFENLSLLLDGWLESEDDLGEAEGEIKEVPVCYGGAFGPDIGEVAAFHGISADVVITLHAAPVYLVYMIGFTPGFAYLGGLDERLHTPRKNEPRKVVAAGSVGIADRQTGIYPIESPGGWQLIGKTPVKLFDLGREAPLLLQAGDRVRFKPITEKDFESYTDR